MFGLFKKKSGKPAPKTPENVFTTNSGMLGLWDYSTYQHIVDYDTWESEFAEDKDIIRNIKSATYVPINIQSDGVFCVDVKLQEDAELSDRERSYLTVSSQPYLLKTKGKVALSGMETVGKEPENNVRIFEVDPGEYEVIIHLIAWDEEPGAKGSDGTPTKDALPDFVVCISSKDNTHQTFRQEVETFRRQDMI